MLALIAGAMAKATVPVLAAQNARDGGSDRTGHTLSVVLTVTLLVLGLGSLVMALAALGRDGARAGIRGAGSGTGGGPHSESCSSPPC